MKTQSAPQPDASAPAAASGGHRAPDRQRKLRKDLRLLATFVRVCCEGQHRDVPKEPFALRGYDATVLGRRPPVLCAGCRKLLAHAFVKRTACPLDPKPMCKHCPQHCYAPAYRARMRAVMRYSGRRLVLSGRLHYLLHLLF